MEPWSMTTLLVCFGGGIVGASLGGLYAFVLCGLIVFLGCLASMAGCGDFLLLSVGLGPIFGPHVGGFTSGIIAITYAEGVKKNAPGGPGSGKDILSPCMNTSWDVLILGGVWAVVAHILLQYLNKIPVLNKFDTIALTVFIGCALARLLFQGVAPWGKMESIREHGYFGTKKGAIQWVPWQHNTPSKIAAFGLGVGLLSVGLAVALKGIMDPLVAKGTVSAAAAFVVPLIFGWSLAAISLIGLNFATGTIQLFPVWHHIAILSALAYLLFGSALVAGVVVGIGAAFLGDIMARMFYNHGRACPTHHVVAAFRVQCALWPQDSTGRRRGHGEHRPLRRASVILPGEDDLHPWRIQGGLQVQRWQE